MPTRFRLGFAHLALAIVVTAFLSFSVIYGRLTDAQPIRSDGVGYYAYLPALFIHRDLSMVWLERTHFQGGPVPEWTGIAPDPASGRYVNKYPAGMAILMGPFFLLGLAASAVLYPGPLTGYETPFQVAAALSGLAYILLGLRLLFNDLKRHFSVHAGLLTLAALTFATNLFHYGTYDSVFSHAYSFFLFSALIRVTGRWRAQASTTNSLWLGVLAGLLVLVRIPNALNLGLMFLLLNVDPRGCLKEDLGRLLGKKEKLLLALVTALLTLTPQVAYWKAATGHWLVRPYQNEGFNFTDPQVVQVLFSPNHGLFVWAPVLLSAVLGLAPLYRVSPRLTFTAAAVFLVHLYMVASWWDWPFGGAYGHRGFIDIYPFLAFPMTACWDRLLDKGRLSTWMACGLVSLCVLVNLMFMAQYWRGRLPISDVTWPSIRKALPF